MKLDKKIESWVKEALISEEQAKRIIEFEESAPSKSWFLYGIAGIGITAMVAGIVSIVAANWAGIPTIVKLIGYFAAQVLLGLGFLKLKDRPGLGREVLLTLFALLFLAGIGLIGQIYNLQSDGYSALFFCCVLTILAALCAQSRILPDVWHIGLLAALLIWVFSGGNKTQVSSHFLYGVSAVYILYALSFLRFKNFAFPVQFGRASRRWCGKAFIALTVVANIGWYNEVRDLIQASAGAYLMLACAVVLLFTTLFFSDPKYDKRLSFSLFGALALLALYLVAPTLFYIQDSRLFACLIFMLIWGLAAAAAVFANRKRLFDLATFIISLRFIVCYFELFGSLAQTGIGLIFSGGIILAIAFIWHKYRSNLIQIIKGVR